MEYVMLGNCGGNGVKDRYYGVVFDTVEDAVALAKESGLMKYGVLTFPRVGDKELVHYAEGKDRRCVRCRRMDEKKFAIFGNGKWLEGVFDTVRAAVTFAKDNGMNDYGVYPDADGCLNRGDHLPYYRVENGAVLCGKEGENEKGQPLPKTLNVMGVTYRMVYHDNIAELGADEPYGWMSTKKREMHIWTGNGVNFAWTTILHETLHAIGDLGRLAILEYDEGGNRNHADIDALATMLADVLLRNDLLKQ